MEKVKTWYDTLKFGVDWVNVTVDCRWVDVFLREVCKACNLDFHAWEMLKGGIRWYPNGMTYTLAGGYSIVLSFHLLEDGTVPVDTSVVNNHGIAVSISGDGCRYLDSVCENGLQKFLNVCREYPHNATRVDVCMDIFDQINPIEPLFTRFAFEGHEDRKGALNIKSGMVRKGDWYKYMPVWDEDRREFTNNVYIGKRTSIAQCNVYNKKVEVRQRLGDQIADQMFHDLGVTDYWYRVEYRAYKKELANTLFESVCDNGALDSFWYMADEFFTFVELSTDIHNINKANEEESWREFCEWLKCHQNGHFVQLTSVRYYATDVLGTLRYAKRCASLISKLNDIMWEFPEFYNSCVEAGYEKRQNDRIRHGSFDHELHYFDMERMKLFI